jgi:signal transduction histidine kinase
LLIRNVNEYNPEKILEFAQNIHVSSEKTYTLLMNLLEWAKLQTGLLVAKPEKTKPDDIISSVVLSCEQHSNSKNIKLIKTIEFNEFIWVDKEMLKFLLRNLITNAIKYTLPNGSVEITVRKSGDDVMFKVSDTGSDFMFTIPVSHLKRLPI